VYTHTHTPSAPTLEQTRAPPRRRFDASTFAPYSLGTLTMLALREFPVPKLAAADVRAAALVVANLRDQVLCVQDLNARAVHVPVWVQRVNLPLVIAALQPALAVPHQLNHRAGRRVQQHIVVFVLRCAPLRPGVGQRLTPPIRRRLRSVGGGGGVAPHARTLLLRLRHAPKRRVPPHGLLRHSRARQRAPRSRRSEPGCRRGHTRRTDLALGNAADRCLVVALDLLLGPR